MKGMKIISLAALLGCLCVFTGCAKQPQLSRTEWLRVTSHEYQGVTKDEALIAVEKLFRLADGDDFKIVHLENGIYAQRPWLIYLVLAAGMGTDYWKITGIETDTGVKLSLQVSVASSAVTPMPTTSGAYTATSLPMGGTPIMGTALYDLFWNRLDYLLGKTNHWETCEEAYKKVKSKQVWGSTEQLCNGFNINDKHPN